MIRMNAIGSIFSLFLGLQLLSTPIRKNGDLSGILESKGEAWVEIKEDSGFRNRYLAPWHGGSPSKGGGFDPRILKIIQETVVGNRVYLKWKHDGHLRIEELAVIVPRESRGIFTGKLVEIGNHWVDFENPDDRIPWRFYLRWIGGYPENGGGYDGRSREELIARSDQGLLRFRWSYDVRPRFDSILNLEGYQEPLFYEVESLPPLLQPSKDPIPPKMENPFDTQGAPKGNPFNTAPVPVNPFESAPTPAAPSGNPFDLQGAPKGNPFDTAPASVNPFESAPAPAAPSGNPFDLQGAPKGNPFDTAPAPAAPSGNPFELEAGKN